MTLLIILGCIAAVAVLTGLFLGRGNTREVTLRHRTLRADARIATEHRKAKQAMNSAAGQAWRNRFE